MIITLTTDFGGFGYVGAMKGVIYSVCPKTTVVDITHDIKKFDVRHAAYILNGACKYFPKGAVHCVVVDPGVGTKRRGVMIKTSKYIFIGPDNGVFTFVEDIKKVYEISYPEKSKTFHGRDIFAPIAAKLACGGDPEEFGTPVKGIKKFEFEEVRVEKNKIIGEVICTDHFGNVITNINNIKWKYGSKVKFEIHEESHEVRFLESYGFARKGELMGLVNSENFLEFAVNQGSAEELLKVKGGEKVKVEK